MLGALTQHWQSPHSVGIDFGASHFKIVRLMRQRDRFHVEACGMAEATLGADEDAAIRRARVFLREHGLKLGKVAVNIEHDSIRIRRMDLAKMPDRDLKVAIRWNFREHVDVPLEKYVVSYTHIPVKPQDERLPMMAYGVALDAVTQCQTRFRKLGLRVASVEPNVSALLAAFDHSVDWVAGERYALVDFGYHETLFAIVGDEALLYSRPLAGVTGERLLRLLSREGAVPPEEAKGLLKAVLSGETLPEECAKLMEEFYTHLLVEMQRSLDGFTALYRVDNAVNRLYVCGGGSVLPNLVGHLSKNLGVPTDILDPFAKIADAAGHMPAQVDQAPLYVVAVGLALPQRRKGKGEGE